MEIELWQINDSLLAPKFNVVEKPNDWAKTMKSIEGMSETDRLKLEFWQAFNDHLGNNPDFQKEFNLRKPQPCHWYDLSLGTSSYYISLNINTQKKKIDAGLYIPNDKEVFHRLQEHKAEFDAAFGTDIEFRDAGKSSRILLYHSINVKDRAKWAEASDWMFQKALIFKKTVKQVDK